MVLEYNREVNLTSITQVEDAIRLNVADSAAVVPLVQRSAKMLADIGSGQGFPAIPLAILLPGLSVSLIESSGKKARVLSEMVKALGLSERVQILNQRAELLNLSDEKQFDVVTARAVASLASLIELSCPIMRMGGQLIAMKGKPQHEEILGAESAGVACGFKLVARTTYHLPAGLENRTVLCFEKVSNPNVSLPRRVGMAQKRPIC